MSLRLFPAVINTVVRLHNLCRRRRIPLPSTIAGDSDCPPVEFHVDSPMIGDHYTTAPLDRVGRPAANQATRSALREAFKQYLGVTGIRAKISTSNALPGLEGPHECRWRRFPTGYPCTCARSTNGAASDNRHVQYTPCGSTLGG